MRILQMGIIDLSILGIIGVLLFSFFSYDFAQAESGGLLEIPKFPANIELSHTSKTSTNSETIQITNFNEIFHRGDTLEFSGFVTNFENPLIDMVIFDPSGNASYISTVPISPDKTFNFSVSLDLVHWNTTGIYKAKFFTEFDSVEKHFWFDSQNNSRKSNDILIVHNYQDIVNNCSDVKCDRIPRLWGPSGASFTWFDVNNKIVNVVVREIVDNREQIIFEEKMSSDIFSYTFDKPGKYTFYFETDHILSYLRNYMVGIVYIDDAQEFSSSTLVYSSSTTMVDSTSPIYDPKEKATVSIPPGKTSPGCENSFDCFLPYSLVIDRGTTIEWSNNDSAAHTVTSGTPKEGPSGEFDSSLFLAGTTFEHTFDENGFFEYFCMIHPWMEGEVTVLSPVLESEDTPPDEEPNPPDVDDIDDFENGQVDLSSASYVKGKQASVSVPKGTSIPGCETNSSCFLPSNLVIEKGATVTWSNDDSAAHTITSGSPSDGPSGVFDSSLFMAGTTFSHTFETLGSFKYFCMVHPWQTGTVTVLDYIQGNSSGENQWDTRPTFGMSHESDNLLIVENGFKFNTDQFTIIDNHHTNFEEQSIILGTTNSFSATVYADKKLKVQEFLFGIPNVGESHLAELGVEVWYNTDGSIEDIQVIQNSEVIDSSSIVASHSKIKCHSSAQEAKCDNTTISMTFLEPLKDKIMAIKAIDFEKRDQRTYLNDGFDISGEPLNPMITKMIPSNQKGGGLLKVTQEAKYSPFWISNDGRTFEMNSFGSFTEINHKFERFQDFGEPRTRLHSGFGGIVENEQARAVEIFDASKLISELPDSFGHHIVIQKRITGEMIQEMVLQEQIAKEILDEMDKQDRHY